MIPLVKSELDKIYSSKSDYREICLSCPWLWMEKKIKPTTFPWELITILHTGLVSHFTYMYDPKNPRLECGLKCYCVSNETSYLAEANTNTLWRNALYVLSFKKNVIYFDVWVFVFWFSWLRWVFIAARGLFSSCREWGLLLLWSMDSRHAGLIVVAHVISCSVACGIFLDQGSNLCPLHWQVDSNHCTTREVPGMYFKWRS